MAWYEDLTECDYLGEEYLKFLTAICWLEKEKPYTKGEISQTIVDKLYEISKLPETLVYFLGYHECDFCGFCDVELGASMFIIGFKEKIYACPAMIIHYIKAHKYLPPPEFLEAVQNYDHQKAMAHLEEIRENILI